MPPRKRAAAAPKKAAARPARKRAPAKKKPAGGATLSVVPNDVSKLPPAPPEKPKVQTLLEAIEAGDYLGILLAQRRDLVTDVKNASGPAKAAMHRQFAMLSKEIAALEAEAKAIAEEEGGSGGSDEDADEAFDSETL